MSTKSERLNDIETHWTRVRLAVEGQRPESSRAQAELMERYSGAIRRYLHAAVGDTGDVDDLMQDFAVALVSGGFEKVDQNRGRFRDYLKGVLFRMVRKHRRKQQRYARHVTNSVDLTDPDAFPAECDEHFRQDWRDELLARTWGELATDDATYFTVLHCRAANPDMPSEKMVAELAPQLGKRLTAESVRQTLRRARKRFVTLLMEQVAGSLEFPAPAAIHEELRDLNLASFVLAPARAI